MTTTRLPPILCPACGNYLDAASSLFDPEARPGPGDLTVCIVCAEVLTWDTNMRLVIPPPARLAKWLRRSPKLADEIARMKTMVRALPPQPPAIFH